MTSIPFGVTAPRDAMRNAVGAEPSVSQLVHDAAFIARNPPHSEVVVVREAEGRVFFRLSGLFSLPRDMFDAAYQPFDRDAGEAEG